ncbi:MAG: hypothetical protein GY757_20075 [bacterium]|nr:hypothetical protein [bacterium]
MPKCPLEGIPFHRIITSVIPPQRRFPDIYLYARPGRSPGTPFPAETRQEQDGVTGGLPSHKGIHPKRATFSGRLPRL